MTKYRLTIVCSLMA